MRPPERVVVRDVQARVEVSLTATVKDSSRYTVDATQHAVEVGANIIDHARPKLITLALEGVVSDLTDGAGKAQEAVGFFVSLQQSPRVVEITTPRVVYEQMLMTSLEMPRKASDGGAARFVVEFLEYKVVSTRREVVKVTLAKPAKKGLQQNKIVLPTANEGGTLKRLQDKGGGGFTGVFTGTVRVIGSLFGGAK